jgi:lipopolysaccharide export system permease protein
MIFQRALIRELSQTATGVFVALLAVLVTTQAIRLLGQAAGGKIASESVLALLGFSTIGFLPVTLSLTLFIAVVLSLSRAYRDSEMIVWFSCGHSLTSWMRPVLSFAWPLVLVITMLSLFLTPWALSKSQDYRNRMDNRSDVTRVSPGNFRESPSAQRIFFVEDARHEDGRVSNIFMNALQNDQQEIMRAAEGRTETMPNGDRFLILDNGYRYEIAPGDTAFRVMSFDRYAVRIESKEQRQLESKPKNKPLWDLLVDRSPASFGEIVWRLGLPLSSLILALLAIPLAFVNPRAGRGNNVLMALLIYMTYNNLLSVSQAWVAQGRLTFSVGLCAIHLLMGLILLLMFYKRLQVRSWWQRWR